MTDTIDRLVRMLDDAREEIRELKRDRAMAHKAQMDATARERRAIRDRDHAEAKIEEWVEHSSSWVPLIPVKRRKEIKPPSPYFREMPF